MEQHRRRLDQVLDPDYLADLDDRTLDELRALRSMAVDVENELSYYRRLLYGRMDLVKFEQRRRSGDEERTLIESLVDILTDPAPRDGSEGTRGIRHIVTDLPPLPDVGKRDIDEVIGDSVLTRLDEATEEELQASIDAYEKTATEINEQRRAAQQVIDHLADVIAERFRAEVSTTGED